MALLFSGGAVDSVSMSSAGGSSDYQRGEFLTDSSDGRVESPRSATSARSQHRLHLAELAGGRLPKLPHRTVANGSAVAAAGVTNRGDNGDCDLDIGVSIVRGHRNGVEANSTSVGKTANEPQRSGIPDLDTAALTPANSRSNTLSAVLPEGHRSASAEDVNGGEQSLLVNYGSPVKSTSQNHKGDAQTLSLTDLASFDPLVMSKNYVESLSNTITRENGKSVDTLTSQVDGMSLDESKENNDNQNTAVATKDTSQAEPSHKTLQAMYAAQGARPKTTNPKLLLNNEEVIRGRPSPSQDWAASEAGKQRLWVNPSTTPHLLAVLARIC